MLLSFVLLFTREVTSQANVPLCVNVFVTDYNQECRSYFFKWIFIFVLSMLFSNDMVLSSVCFAQFFFLSNWLTSSSTFESLCWHKYLFYCSLWVNNVCTFTFCFWCSWFKIFISFIEGIGWLRTKTNSVIWQESWSFFKAMWSLTLDDEHPPLPSMLAINNYSLIRFQFSNKMKLNELSFINVLQVWSPQCTPLSSCLSTI